jgi:hypothetical protein
VLASFFNSSIDPQRNITWDRDVPKLMPLINSVTKQDIKIKIFHDCFDDVKNTPHCEWIKVEPKPEYALTVARFFHQLEFLLTSSEEFEFVFMVDSTDVELLKNPFTEMKNDTLYSGDEVREVNNVWMRRKERLLKIDDYNEVMSPHYKSALLNCGLCGGDRRTVVDFLELLTGYYNEYSSGVVEETLAMPIYNYTIFKHFLSKVSHGAHVNTEFKKNQRNNTSWWKHK